MKRTASNTQIVTEKIRTQRSLKSSMESQISQAMPTIKALIRYHMGVVDFERLTFHAGYTQPRPRSRVL